MNQIAISLVDRLRSLEKSLVYVTTSLQSSIYQEQKDHYNNSQSDRYEVMTSDEHSSA